MVDISNIGSAKTAELVELRWKGLQKLRSRLGDEKIDFKQLGGYELLVSGIEEFQERMIEVNNLLRPVFRQDVFMDQSQQLDAFGFRGFGSLLG